MVRHIRDYALLSDLHCAALVSNAGSIDWFCPRRFDAPACFAALLGTEEHGQCQIAPRISYTSKRRYREDTLVLETDFTTAQGSVRVVDAMPIGAGCHIIRLVEGLAGEVPMSISCSPRFGYGRYCPKVDSDPEHGVIFCWEGQRLALASNLGPMQLEGGDARRDFSIQAGEQYWCLLSFADADQTLPQPFDCRAAIDDTAHWWRHWISHCQYRGEWQAEVKRSLITLKAMTYAPSGGMVAAVTTSLPEIIGGPANYDYRFCWLRDAAFALKVLLSEGFQQEADAWDNWLLSAIRQHDMPLHVLYDIDAGKAPNERELPWLPGFRNSRPVREGNAASQQYQLDVRGELMEVLHLARCSGLRLEEEIWPLQRDILERLAERWHLPDRGIWEFREIHDHLTHSKVFCWLAFDRCIRDAETFDLEAPLDQWRRIRKDIRADILQHGVHPEGAYFTQRYGADDVDASALLIPLVGFVPADDPRMKATVAAIERDLCEDGLVRRYRTGDSANEEGIFLPCCFWMADNYWLSGRRQEARALFERLLGLCNDVGLLSEECIPGSNELIGNFPQGLCHLALISSARLISTGSEADTSLT